MKPISTTYGSPNVTALTSPLFSSTDPSTAGTDSGPALLPNVDLSGGDPIALIAKLMTQNAQQQQNQDDISADAEDKLEDAADARRIDALQKKADDSFSAGLAGGIAQVAQGGLSMASAYVGMRSLNQGNDPKVAEIKMKPFEAGGELASGTGKIAEAGLKKGADDADVDAAKAESGSKVAKRASDALRKQSDAASQSQQKVLQLLQDIKQQQDQATHAALLKM